MYKVLDKEKFRYAGRLKIRKGALKHSSGHILISSSTDLSKIPPNVQLITTLVDKVNYWEIILPKNGEFGNYGAKDVEELAKKMDAVAYIT
tara:strand:+ start:323 stop:595 length:273 start_codon:yes stop_codon:yes gene_type:complete